MNHRLLLVAIAALSLGGCAVAPEEDPVQIRLKDFEARMQKMERIVTPQSLMDIAKRIDALQADIRSLRGDVELLQNSSEGGKNQSRALYGDLEKRLAALETLGGVGGGAAPSAGAPAVVGPALPGGEQASYDVAFNALKGADYPKAISGFGAFVSSYPSSPLASNAQYWLGEAYYVTRDYPNAITAFQKVTTGWPDSRKVPDALVKIGFTQAAQGKNGDARVTLEGVVQRFPGTEASTLASERLKRLPAK
jgi:tol-pal system protein YbgF